jgi:hypothetical protein
VNAVFSGAGGRSAPSYRTKTLPPGASTTVTVVYTVARADIRAGKPIVGTATVVGRRFYTVGNTASSNTSSVRVAVR